MAISRRTPLAPALWLADPSFREKRRLRRRRMVLARPSGAHGISEFGPAHAPPRLPDPCRKWCNEMDLGDCDAVGMKIARTMWCVGLCAEPTPVNYTIPRTIDPPAPKRGDSVDDVIILGGATGAACELRRSGGGGSHLSLCARGPQAMPSAPEVRCWEDEAPDIALPRPSLNPFTPNDSGDTFDSALRL